MRLRRATLLCSLALLGVAPSASPAPTIDIAKVTCSDLDRATPLDRAAVVMFFWGYEAAKNGATTFRTGMLERATEKLTATCRANPARTLVDAVHDLGVKPF